MTRYLVALIFSAFLLALPQTSEAACSEDTWYQINPTHIRIEGYCDSKAEAHQACLAYKLAHNASNSACAEGTSAPFVSVSGIHHDYLNNIVTPFRSVKFYYPDPDQPSELARPQKNAGPPPCPEDCFGDPVNSGTGNKFETRREYQGTGAFPLELSWTYNSFDIRNTPLDTALTLGRNRTHSYSSNISYFPEALIPAAYLKRPDGKSLRFKKSGANWIADADIKGRLSTTTDAVGTITSWEYVDGNEVREIFDASGSSPPDTTKRVINMSCFMMPRGVFHPSPMSPTAN